MSTPPRLRVIALGIGAGCGLLAAGAFGYARLRGTYHFYSSDFDAYLGRSFPHLSQALHENLALNDEVHAKTRAVFELGGAGAATTMFWHIMHARLLSAASDSAIRGCEDAWTDGFRSLQTHPHVCKLLPMLGPSALSPNDAKSELQHANAACDIAMADGAARQNAPPTAMYGSEYVRVRDGATSSPNPFTKSELATWSNPDSGSDEDMCRLILKYDGNLDALDPTTEASFLRGEYAYEANEPYETIVPPPPSPPPPDDALTCAPTGTRFVLNNFLTDGRPNMWTSLGRHGFDCGIRSAATGVRSLFGTLLTTLDVSTDPNPVRALWPLKVGKSVEIHYISVGEPILDETVSVTSEANYWLPWRRVDAFAIATEVRRPPYHYVVTDYWSPDLGFLIGRQTRSIARPYPPDVGLDFQLVAMLPPG
jgi:hypothetical protein